ncbi:hypothetical protein M0R19_05615 [Candidatus Pacearchaeota archaeon]|jgi:hypothetical protein|nr:hypothetical protein [Candidatus Pacearchaeota archaeon]
MFYVYDEQKIEYLEALASLWSIRFSSMSSFYTFIDPWCYIKVHTSLTYLLPFSLEIIEKSFPFLYMLWRNERNSFEKALRRNSYKW